MVELRTDVPLGVQEAQGAIPVFSGEDIWAFLSQWELRTVAKKVDAAAKRAAARAKVGSP